ncbi:MAG: fructose-bisphosphatase class II, partial [Anaerolineae bacterium]
MPNAPSMVKVVTSRNLGLDLVRATEAAALAAGRYVGLDHPDEADHIAGDAMYQILNSLDMDGYIVTGEELKLGMHSPFDTGARIGTGKGPMLDVVVDPIEGRSLLASGRSGAIAACAVAPVGSMWAPQQAIYMEKIIVDAEVAPALVPECMDAPAAWTLALVARLKKKDIHDLVVFVLDRPRHAELVDEIRRAGARVMLRAAGDVAGALLV